jgi:type III secretion protein J
MRRLIPILFFATACRQPIQHDLDEPEANQLVARLSESGIAAQSEREGGRNAKWKVSVSTRDTTAAIRVLGELELPKARAPGFAEVFGKGSMVPTPVEENALYIHALQGELSRTLQELSGVVSARVHLVAGANPSSTLSRAPVRPRASVLLKVRRGQARDLRAKGAEIAALVAGGVDGLEASQVAVLFEEAILLAPAPQVAPGAGVPKAIFIAAASLITLLSVAVALSIGYARRIRLRAQGVAPSRLPAKPPATSGERPLAVQTSLQRCA